MDPLYIAYLASGALILVAVIFGIVTQARISSTYSEMSKIQTSRGVSGKELAENMARRNFLNVHIREIGGTLSDHFDPRDKSINLSKANYNGSSVAALGVVAHEMGHAIQEKEGYKPYKIRQTVVKVSSFVSKAFFPIVLIGLLFNFAYIGGIVGMVIIGAALVFYGATLIANLATLPVEIDASKRAMASLQELGVMSDDELNGARKVLKAAAMTYVASLLMSFVYFLRFLLYAILITRDDR